MLVNIAKYTFVIAVALLSALSISEQSFAQQKESLQLQAQLSADSPVLDRNVNWRIFRFRTETDNSLEELEHKIGGTQSVRLTKGEYFVHVSYGLSGLAKKVDFTQNGQLETFILNAGGIKLNATASENIPVSPDYLRFDVYENEIAASGNRKTVVAGVRAGEIVAIPTGTYHVVSRYGKLNATARAELRVRPGQLTEASFQHRAALLTFRLSREAGGDAVADTAWTILAENGEVISESNSTFPKMVLSEGNYTAIARHSDASYSTDFAVKSGFDSEIEVLLPN